MIVLAVVQAVDEAHAGDIVMVAGLSAIGIGDTIVDPTNPHVRSSVWKCRVPRQADTRPLMFLWAFWSNRQNDPTYVVTPVVFNAHLPLPNCCVHSSSVVLRGQPMVPIAVEEPTVRMTFGVNKSPLAGREGKFLTTRMIRDRLMKELDRNVALRVEQTDSSDAYEVRT